MHKKDHCENRTFLFMSLSLLLLIFSFSCQQKAYTTSQKSEELNLEGLLKNKNGIRSPDGKYLVLIQELNETNISSLSIVSLVDSTIVFRENNYYDYANWISEKVVRVYTKPEIVKSDSASSNYFDYDVEKKKKLISNF